jgi:TRAP-type C4-dicarboxylate transport system permease small subunit
MRAIVRALAGLGVLAYGAAALVTVADILGRQVGLPVEGVVDLVQLFIMAGAWLVMPFVFMSGAHVGVDFVVDALPRGLSLVLQGFAALVALVLVALMLWQGWGTFSIRTMFGDTSQQLGIPVAWYWYPLLVGLTISLLAIPLYFIECLNPESKT